MKMIGVYKILNIQNGKCYIGSTSTIGFQKRWKKHLLDLKNNEHHSIPLQRAWNKYGENNFIFEIVEKCTKNLCINREQYYFDKIKPEYNVCQKAESTLGYKFPKSYCKKLKIIRKGENNPFYGKHHNNETRDILRKINKGKWSGKKNPKYKKGYLIQGKNNPFYGQKHSDKTKKIISEKAKARNLISNNHPNFIGQFIFFHKIHGKEICGMCDLVRRFKLNNSHVWSICNGKRNSHHGWVCLGKK